jgi:hypothetical protein
MVRSLTCYNTRGRGVVDERRFLFLWFVSETSIQEWSPVMHEVRASYGIRCGPFRFLFSTTYKKWLDGREPMWSR